MFTCIFLNGQEQGVLRYAPSLQETINIPRKKESLSVSSSGEIPYKIEPHIQYILTFFSVSRECGLYTTTGEWEELIKYGDWVHSPSVLRRQPIIFKEPLLPYEKVSLKDNMTNALKMCEDGRLDGAKYFLQEALQLFEKKES